LDISEMSVDTVALDVDGIVEQRMAGIAPR
jgi:hypothetical protein